MERIARLYKALSEEPRLRILALLMRHGELCVCDLEAALGATQSKTSRHVRYLAAAGLVQDRRDGVRMLYRLLDEPDAEMADVLEGFRVFAEDAGRNRDDEDRLRRWSVGRSLADVSGPVALG